MWKWVLAKKPNNALKQEKWRIFFLSSFEKQSKISKM